MPGSASQIQKRKNQSSYESQNHMSAQRQSQQYSSMQHNEKIMKSNAVAQSQSNMTQEKIFQQLQQVFNKSKQ